MATNSPENTLSIAALFNVLLRRKLYIIVPTVLLGAGFAWYAFHLPNQYRAQALIAASNLASPYYLKEVAPQPLNIQDHLWTVREVMFSSPVLEKAARQLATYRDVQGPLPAESLDEFKEAVSIKVDGEHTFTVSYEGDKPEEVANATNALSQTFVDLASARTTQRTEDTQTILKQQISDLKARLQQQDVQVRSYKQGAAHELPEHVDDNIRAVDELQAHALTTESKIADDEARRTSIQKELHQLEAEGALEQAPPPPPEKTPAESRLEDLRFKLNELQARGYKPSMPDVVKLQREIDDVQQTVANQPPKTSPRSEPSQTYLRYVQLKAEMEGIGERIASYRREKEAISTQMQTYNRRVESAPRHERNLDALTREMVVGESQLHALLDKQLDSQISEGLQKSGSGIAFTVIEPPAVPKEPYSPKRARIILMGICGGFGLGLALAFLLEQSDTTFGSLDDFQAFTSMPLIGVIPNISGRKKEAKRPSRKAIVTLSDPESVPAEQYGILAMKIHQLSMQESARVLMVTSAAGGEGKSMTAVNLSVALAALTGDPVLLVDADMRKPRLHEYLDAQLSTDKGFHDLLLHPDDDIRSYATPFDGVDVIRGSQPTPNPIAALASPKVRVLFDRLKQQYKLIVVDAPPTLPVADSHILSGLCDKVLFVVRSRRTPRDLFQHAVESFDAGHLVGAVLNDVECQRTSYGYAYRYYRENYLARK